MSNANCECEPLEDPNFVVSIDHGVQPLLEKGKGGHCPYFELGPQYDVILMDEMSIQTPTGITIRVPEGYLVIVRALGDPLHSPVLPTIYRHRHGTVMMNIHLSHFGENPIIIPKGTKLAKLSFTKDRGYVVDNV